MISINYLVAGTTSTEPVSQGPLRGHDASSLKLVAVFVEFDLLGTQLGEFAGFAPTGREFRCRMAAIFDFTGERIVCERVYFDSATILRQLGLLGERT